MKFIEYELRSVTCEEGQFDFRQPLVPGGNKPGDINHECPPPWRAVAFDSCQESRELSENMLPAEEEKKKRNEKQFFVLLLLRKCHPALMELRLLRHPH